KTSSQPVLTKTRLAKDLGISRSSLYYQPRKPQKDWHLKNQIELILHRTRYFEPYFGLVRNAG
ncbi:hypothetical protein KKE14_02960, partial [Patescibacteria group bacterium]|nr:hypothetical protein [Patescibacteria group bacterium]